VFVARHGRDRLRSTGGRQGAWAGERPFHIIAKSSIARLAAWAHKRGWNHLSLVSTAGNNYDADYFGDTSKSSKGMRALHRVPVDPLWGLLDKVQSRSGRTRPSRSGDSVSHEQSSDVTFINFSSNDYELTRSAACVVETEAHADAEQQPGAGGRPELRRVGDDCGLRRERAA
jgi:hypothetical protein